MILLRRRDWFYNYLNRGITLKLCVPSSSSINRIVIAGDFCPINGACEAVVGNDVVVDVYGGLRPIIENADIKIVNLEAPLTTCKHASPKIGPSLKAKPNMIKLLTDVQTSIVTLANNHIMDYGECGLIDTMKYCTSEGIEFVGAGLNLKVAAKPLLIDRTDFKLAIINATEHEFGIAGSSSPGANPQDLISIYHQIRRLRSNDFAVLLILHGGHENNPIPSPKTVERYRFFADAGASAIVSHHTHCVSGYETYHGVPIFYGIGNFLFDYPEVSHNTWHTGALLSLDISYNSIIGWSITPFVQKYNYPTYINLMSTEESQLFFKNLHAINAIINEPTHLEAIFTDFCKDSEGKILRALFLPHSRLKHVYNSAFARQLLQNSNHMRLILNLMRCEAHREMCLDILESITT